MYKMKYGLMFVYLQNYFSLFTYGNKNMIITNTAKWTIQHICYNEQLFDLFCNTLGAIQSNILYNPR